jgi:ferredoxin
MKRKIIIIDNELCNGCGACAKGCNEGAIQMIDGKARLVSELYCDGLGACIGECPVGAIKIEEREAAPYDEIAVMERISKNGEGTILAHLEHLKKHGEIGYMKQGIAYLMQHNINIDLTKLQDEEHGHCGNKNGEEEKMACGCPGSMARSFTAQAFTATAAGVNNRVATYDSVQGGEQRSELTHWPVQLHLLNPDAAYFHGADVVLAADCTAYAYAGFHSELLKGKKLAIACPKLDSNKEIYVDKIAEMIESSKINTLTVVIMEVPCCGGLLQIVKSATEKVSRKIPVKKIVIGIQGEIKVDEWQ